MVAEDPDSAARLKWWERYADGLENELADESRKRLKADTHFWTALILSGVVPTVVLQDEWANGAWWQNLLWFSAYVLAFGFCLHCFVFHSHSHPHSHSSVLSARGGRC